MKLKNIIKFVAGLLASSLFIYAGMYLMVNSTNMFLFSTGFLGNLFGSYSFLKLILEYKWQN